MGVKMMPFDFLDIGDVIKRYPGITTKARSLVFSKEMKKRLVKDVTTPIKNDILDQYGVELEIGLKKCQERAVRIAEIMLARDCINEVIIKGDVTMKGVIQQKRWNEEEKKHILHLVKTVTRAGVNDFVGQEFEGMVEELFSALYSGL